MLYLDDEESLDIIQVDLPGDLFFQPQVQYNPGEESVQVPENEEICIFGGYFGSKNSECLIEFWDTVIILMVLFTILLIAIPIIWKKRMDDMKLEKEGQFQYDKMAA